MWMFCVAPSVSLPIEAAGEMSLLRCLQLRSGILSESEERTYLAKSSPSTLVKVDLTFPLSLAMYSCLDRTPSRACDPSSVAASTESAGVEASGSENGDSRTFTDTRLLRGEKMDELG